MKPFHPKSAKVPTRGGPNQERNASRKKRRDDRLSIRDLLKYPYIKMDVMLHGPKRVINGAKGIVVNIFPNQDTFLDVVKLINPEFDPRYERWIAVAKVKDTPEAELNEKVSVIIKKYRRFQTNRHFNIYLKSLGSTEFTFQEIERAKAEAEAQAKAKEAVKRKRSSNKKKENGKKINGALDAAAVVPTGDGDVIIQPPERPMEV